jgi:hypothetical protein
MFDKDRKKEKILSENQILLKSNEMKMKVNPIRLKPIKNVFKIIFVV